MESERFNQTKRFEDYNQDMFFDISLNRIRQDYPLHWHDFYELEYVQSGHATQIINGKAHSISPGYAILLSPMDFHCYQNVSSDDPLVIYNIRFSDLILSTALRSRLRTSTVVLQHHYPSIDAVLDYLMKEYHEDLPGREEFICSTVTQLCILTLRSRNDQEEPTDKKALHKQHAPIQEAVLYIRNHYRDSITVDEVANVIHLTPNYFSEYFKKQTGIKFCSYVQKLRLEFSVSLLKMSDLSIKEIADESGFNSAAYFSNAFKDYFGVSPEQFRKTQPRLYAASKKSNQKKD